MSVTLDRCRCATTCGARSPYGAPQLDVPVRLNTNENPFPPPPELVADVARAVREVAAEPATATRTGTPIALRRTSPPTSPRRRACR